MAAELRITTVARSISELTIEGLITLDIDNVKANPEGRASFLMPDSEYITDVTAEVRSFGGASAMWDISYTLNYRLLYKPLGTERTMTIAQMSGMVEMIGKIWDAIMAIGVFSGCEDITINRINSFGPVAAPNDDVWWGCLLGFRVMEQIR